MHQRKGKKILIYFFLLILVGSINNINLNNINFREIKNINVTGLENEANSILLQEIKDLNLDNIFLINKNRIINQIDRNSLVGKFNIFKKYPSTIDIKINKTKFLARTKKNGKIFIVGSNGKLLENDLSNNQLPFIFGNPNMDEFLSFIKTINQSKIPYKKIKNFYFFSSKRWDLELRNNKIIKLPENYTKESLKLAFEFLHSDEFKDIKIIDARIKNQIILND